MWSKLRRLARQPFVVAPLAAVLAIGGFVGYRSATTSSSASPARTERIVAATSGTIAQSVSASGTIEPESTEDLSFSVSGAVTAVDVKAGDAVATGQVLATVDSASLQSDEAQAQATVATDQAKVASDTSSGASSAQLSADQAALTAARSQLTTAQAALAGATLTSPIAGTVAAVNLTVGQQLGSSGGSGSSLTGSGSGGGGTAPTSSSSSSAAAGGGSATGATGTTGSASTSSPEVEVISTGTYVVNLSVDDTEIAHITSGETATVTPSGATTSATGTVTSVGTIASSSSGVSSFPVVVTVTGNPTGFYGGDTATVAVVYQHVADAVEVPVAAVSQGPAGSTVTLVSGRHRSTRTVTTGVQANGEIQVTSGLAAGDQVVEEIPTFAGSGRARTGTQAGTGAGPGGGSGSGPPGGFGGGGFGGGTGSGSGAPTGVGSGAGQ